MSRTLCMMAAAWAVLGASAVLGQTASEVADLRQHNTAILQARHLERAVFIREQRAPETAASLAQLLAVVQQQSITAVFVDINGFATDPVTTVERRYRWNHFLGELHRAGASVYGCVGDSGTLTDYGTLYAAVDQLAGFQMAGQPGQNFDGMLIEQPLLSTLTPPAPQAGGAEAAKPGEPQGLLDPAAFGAAPDNGKQVDAPSATLTSLSDEVLMGKLLDTIDRVRRYARSRFGNLTLRVGVAIPAWLTGSFRWRGQVKDLGQQFVDVTDFLVVHNLPNNTTDVGTTAQRLIRYCGEQRKPLLLRLELLYALRPSPVLLSLFGRDRWFVETTIRDLLEDYGKAPGFGGVVLDDLAHLLAMPLVRDARPGQDSGTPVREPVDLDRPLGTSPSPGAVVPR